MSEPESFRVEIEKQALADIDAIAAYLAEHAGSDTAREFLAAVLTRIDSLETFPYRGSEPKEFGASNPAGYRQILLRRHRIFYRIQGATVIVSLIADGRRDMQALLTERLAPDPPA